MRGVGDELNALVRVETYSEGIHWRLQTDRPFEDLARIAQQGRMIMALFFGAIFGGSQGGVSSRLSVARVDKDPQQPQPRQGVHPGPRGSHLEGFLLSRNASPLRSPAGVRRAVRRAGPPAFR